MMNAGISGLFMIPLFLLYFALIGVSIYCMVLFIKLAHRGIKALDIFIDKNQNR